MDTPPNPPSTEYLTKVRETLINTCTLQELQALATDLGVDYESLEGDGKAGKALSLVLYLSRRKRIPDLVAHFNKKFASQESQPQDKDGSTSNTTPTASAVKPDPATPKSPKQLNFRERSTLVEALLAVPTIADRNRRMTVIHELPAAISQNIVNDSVDNTHVLNMVKACLQYEDGIQELLAIVRFFEKASIPMQQLDATYRTIFGE
jgi:hypothetical protein